MVIAGIVAGGRAERLGGRFKPLIEIDGEPIIAHQLAVLVPRVDRVVVSTNQPELLAGRGLQTVPDRIAGGGPLVGLASLLEATGADWMLAVGGDMPRIRGEAVELVLSRIDESVDLVVPFVAGLPEPLFAAYSARCLPEMQRRIDAGQFRTSALARGDALRLARIEETELRAVDPELESLGNINRPEDLAQLGLKTNG